MCIRAFPYLPYKAVLWIRIDILDVDSEWIRIQEAVGGPNGLQEGKNINFYALKTWNVLSGGQLLNLRLGLKRNT
jgi:hypothetical protein